MKLLVIGCGQCGGRVAEEFARLGVKARVRRGIGIITDSLAVNTDTADLTGLSFIKHDYDHRIVIGTRSTSGHGVGKINELGAEIAKEDSDKVLEAIGKTRYLPETDAFLVAASAAGGTGSGAIGVLTQRLKEHYPQKPVYNLIVLPFRHEELAEERSIFNTATCLKSVYLVADAIILIDNQQFVKKGLSLSNNLSRINSLAIEPFYNMLCAGEEKVPEYIGSRVLDAGDIIQSLAGWSAIGYGRMRGPSFRLPFADKGNFRERASQAQEAIQTMNAALSDLSIKCEPLDANRALYLLCAPAKKMAVEVVGELSSALKRFATNAIIRSGDYPRVKNSLEITIILSELSNVRRVTDIFRKAVLYINDRRKQRGKDFESRQLETSFGDIPSLLD